MELNDILFFLKSLRSPTSAFDILDYVIFCESNTRSSSSHKLSHSHCSSTLSSHFYFKRLPRLWNCLPKTFLRRQLYLLSNGLISLSITTLLIHALFTYHVHVLTVSLLSLTVPILDPNHFSGCLTVRQSFSHTF